jgi:FkbM family methyltransferase
MLSQTERLNLRRGKTKKTFVGLKHILNHSFSNVVSGLGSAFKAKSLPSHFNGRWVRFSPKCWAALHQKYEPYMARVLQSGLHPGGVFLDVGAHFGLWSVYAASIVGRTGKAFAFEPSPAFAVLRENAALNSPVQAFNMGLGAEDGEAIFFDQGTASSGSFVNEVTRINERFQPTVPIGGNKVKICTLDTLLAELGTRPDLIKVDVEGFEFEVMRGAENVLRNMRPVILIEIHPPQLKLSGSSDQALIAFLESKGYALEVIDRNPNSIYTILAKPKPR